jgi:hypothetical protein
MNRYGTWGLFLGMALVFGPILHAEDLDSLITDKNPGLGSLNFHHGTENEFIELGPAHYGYGIIFSSAAFPEFTAEEFKGKYLLQIALGNTKSKETKKAAQFSTLSILSQAFPSKAKTFNVVLRSAKPLGFEEKALVLFSSPKLGFDISEEEKLKDTYYGRAGTIAIHAQDSPTLVNVKGQSEPVSFKSQMYRIDFKVALSTPFNPVDGDLTGVMLLPVYWPAGKSAEKFTRQIASKNPTNLTPVQAPEGITSHKRELSGSTRRDKNSGSVPGGSVAP